MKLKSILVALSLVFAFSACQSEADQSAERIAEVEQIAQSLIEDQGNANLKKLKPGEAEIKSVFTEAAAAKLLSYSNRNWKMVDRSMPPNAMKPSTEDGSVAVHRITKADLVAGNWGNFPVEYSGLADHLKEGSSLYAIEYLKADGSSDKFRSSFFRANDQWYFIPLPYLAFEE